MTEHNKVNINWSDLQLNKLESAVKSQTETTLRLNIKMFEGNNLLYELLLQQDKQSHKQMHLKIVYQLINGCLKLKYLK